ncbi:hypothetical protein SAMN05192559_11123 [Halobacillus karajensis]|uniref:Uncharacterized protein n=1 Tax=Halobacillus karajensis TaxID=195088 RepID=A0A024P9H3_9BACI|nr:hypothetical protein [Halobacillus karajensis]CDQ21574.1 hypothetical protein BN982_03977 [Halobacillus karajensis]CDQ25508.1 hypothetical protein BN983_03855 [Halobacillus karajensis]CDQ28961.1 hypothetical protein BN981_03304 [Halobacillus karajensis]SEI08834.1 hypothetical protein SAMN05192559_11123 [Halobacillus karajensis]
MTNIFYSIFILAAVIATFFVIFKKLSKSSYWTIGIIAVLYIIILAFSFSTHTP